MWSISSPATFFVTFTDVEGGDDDGGRRSKQ